MSLAWSSSGAVSGLVEEVVVSENEMIFQSRYEYLE